MSDNLTRGLHTHRLCRAHNPGSSTIGLTIARCESCRRALRQGRAVLTYFAHDRAVWPDIRSMLKPEQQERYDQSSA